MIWVFFFRFFFCEVIVISHILSWGVIEMNDDDVRRCGAEREKNGRLLHSEDDFRFFHSEKIKITRGRTVVNEII